VQAAHLTQRMAVVAGWRIPMVQMQPMATYLRQEQIRKALRCNIHLRHTVVRAA